MEAKFVKVSDEGTFGYKGKRTMLSNRAIERILRRKIKGDVSRDGILFVKEFLQFICEFVADEGNKRLEEINQLRKLHGQYQLKRIPSSIYKKILEDLFKELSNIEHGNVGNAPESVSTTLSEADENRWYYA